MATTYYRYLLADVLTNQILAELPLTSVQFSQQLNSAGTFSAELQLAGLQAANLNVANATIPGRTAIYVDRDGTLVWGGVLWNREYSSKTQSIKLNAGEFESYWNRRRITTDTVFTNTDQLTAVQTIVTNANAATKKYRASGISIPSAKIADVPDAPTLGLTADEVAALTA